MIWEVFRRETEDADFVYCRDVHAPDREMAKQFAVIQHGRRKPTDALWVVPQEKITSVSPGDDPGESTSDESESTWVVFRQDRAGGYHAHCGNVSAADTVEAQQAALDEYAVDDPHNLWVVREQYIGEITSDDVTFGGTTDKSYRYAQTYNVDPAAEEVEESESEQVEAERKRKRGEA